VSLARDILLVKGNPLENILILRDYKENIHLIMKDGKVYKNELQISEDSLRETVKTANLAMTEDL